MSIVKAALSQAWSILANNLDSEVPVKKCRWGSLTKLEVVQDLVEQASFWLKTMVILSRRSTQELPHTKEVTIWNLQVI